MTHSETNKKFISTLPAIVKTEMIQNIALHYGISNDEVENEIFDEEAENIFDYVTGSFRSKLYSFYINFQNQ